MVCPTSLNALKWGTPVINNWGLKPYGFISQRINHPVLSEADEIIERKITLLTKLQNTVQFEDEKIDIVVKRKSKTYELPIYQVAMHEGVKL